MTALEIALIAVADGQQEKFLAGIREGAAIIARQPGCSAVEVLQGVEDPSAFRLFAHWDDVEAHNAFRASPDFPRYRATVQETFLVAPTYEHWARRFKAGEVE